MITLTGKSACGGIAIGQISFYKRKRYLVEYRRIQDVEAEIARFEAARTLALDQIHALCQKATQAVGKENAMIFHVHQRMLEDPDYCESVTGRIRTEQVTAEYAVSATADQFAQMFASLDDAYMQERAMDVKDISARVLGILSGQGNGRAGTETPSIIAADDLVPSETVQLDKGKVLGFATMYGAPTSHTAILARTMNIPAVIGLGENLKEEYDGKQAVIDGFTGMVYICLLYTSRCV